MESFQKALLKYPKFIDLWNGKWEQHFDSQSEADLSFCRILHNCNARQHEIDALMRTSSLYRAKWDEKRGEKTYGELTIHTVITT